LMMKRIWGILTKIFSNLVILMKVHLWFVIIASVKFSFGKKMMLVAKLVSKS